MSYNTFPKESALIIKCCWQTFFEKLLVSLLQGFVSKINQALSELKQDLSTHLSSYGRYPSWGECDQSIK